MIISDNIGRKVAFLGDSITAGTGATSGSYSFFVLTPKILGTGKVASTGTSAYIQGGVSGDTSEKLLARLAPIVAQSPSLAIVMIGTNASVDMATYMASIRSIFNVLKVANVLPVFCTIPPRGTTSARTNQYNSFLRLFCARSKISLVDIYSLLVDPATGLLAASYDSGDGVHPSNAGHLAIALTVADALDQVIPSLPSPAEYGDANGLIPNSFQPTTSGWSDAGGTATGAVMSVVAPVAGDRITKGNWLSLFIENTAGGSSVNKTKYQSLTPQPNPGDVLMFSFVGKQDGTGVAGEDVKIAFSDSYTDLNLLLSSFGVSNPGRTISIATAPASFTSLRLRLIVTAQAGKTNTGMIGELQCWNLTQLGMVGQD